MRSYKQFLEKHQELLKTRAKRVERAAQQAETRQLVEVLTVHLYFEKYAIPIEDVQAIYEEISITQLPDVPPHIAGIANLRGQLVTVLNLAQILDVPIAHGNEQYTLVMLTYTDANIALQVQKIGEVNTLAIDELNSVTAANAQHQNYLQGVLADGTVLLDLQELLNDPALEVNQSD